MSTGLAEAPPQVDERVISYTPFGESKAIKLTLGMVRSYIAVPTRQGKVPSDAELMKFIMLCQARELNPWVGDAYLVGYDSQDGPKFSLITAIQALLKRAEVNPHFDGMESGVVVLKGDEVRERQGDLVLPGETLHGAWAKCHRKDRSVPFYDSLKLATYNTNKSQWAKDPAGMIVKCAEASVLRKAFPSQVGSLYIEQERGLLERRQETVAEKPRMGQKLSTITQAITGRIEHQETQGERFTRTADESQEEHSDAIVTDAPEDSGSGDSQSRQSVSQSQDSTAAASYTPIDRAKALGEFAEASSVTEVNQVLAAWRDFATEDDLAWLDKMAKSRRSEVRK